MPHIHPQSSEKSKVKRFGRASFCLIIWPLIECVGTAGMLGYHCPHIPCGKVLLSYAAILALHIVLLLTALCEPVQKAPQFQKVVHTKR